MSHRELRESVALVLKGFWTSPNVFTLCRHLALFGTGRSQGKSIVLALEIKLFHFWNDTTCFRFRFSPFYWARFVAQRERAQQDSKVPYKVPHLTHPPFTYVRQPQHRDHPTLIRIVRGLFNVPQNYQHSRNCETGPPVYSPYSRRLEVLIRESLTICRWNYKGSTFLLSYFKDPECWSGRSLEITTSRVSAKYTTKWVTGN